MNRQTKSLCITSTCVIEGSLKAHDGQHVVSILNNLVTASGIIYIGVAGSADTVERFAALMAVHEDKAKAIPKILIDQPTLYFESVIGHVIKALSRTHKLTELIEELALLAAIADEPRQSHYRAAEWGISLVSVGTLLAAAAELLESETTEPESVASIMTYICQYVLTSAHPSERRIQRFANEPPMLSLAATISRALNSDEFTTATKIMKHALVPAREYLTPLPRYYN